MSDWINLKDDLHAVGDGINDDTNALLAGFADPRPLYMPAGRYMSSSALSILQSEKRIEGAGRALTQVVANAGFIGSSLITFPTSQPGPVLRNFWVTAVDRGVISRGIDARNCARFKMHDMRVTMFDTGTDMSGNCGGADLVGVEAWNKSRSFFTDGSLDVVNFDRCRVWPFDAPADPDGSGNPIFLSSQQGFEIGHIDGLSMSQCMTYSKFGVCVHIGSNGLSCSGTIDNCEFDSFNGFQMSDGRITLSNSLLSGGNVNGVACAANVSQTGGRLILGNNRFFNNIGTMVYQTAGKLIATGNDFEQVANNAAGGVVINGTQATAIVSDNNFSRPSGLSQTSGMLHQVNGRLTAVGNRGPIDGTGRFIIVERDEWHYIAGNRAGAWTHSFAPAVSAIYRDN